MQVVDFQGKKAEYYDSFKSDYPNCWKRIRFSLDYLSQACIVFYYRGFLEERCKDIYKKASSSVE